MRRKVGILFISLMSCLVWSVASGAVEMQGKVIDVFPGGVSVLSEGQTLFGKGEQVELSYQADRMEMVIGQYRITDVLDRVLIMNESSVGTPPLKDTVVKIVPALGPSAKLLSEKKDAVTVPAQKAEWSTAADGQATAQVTELQKTKPAGEAQAALPPSKTSETQGSGLVIESTPIHKLQVRFVKAPPAGRIPKGAVPGKKDSTDFNIFVDEKHSGQEPVGQWWLGVLVSSDEASSYKEKKSGVRIEKVEPRSPAAQAGLKVNDIIIKIDQIVITGPEHCLRLLTQSNGRVSLDIQRGKKFIQKLVSLQRLVKKE